MTKAKISVTQRTYAKLVEKRVLLENIIALEQKEKAMENGNRLENIQNSDAEFHPSLNVNEFRLREVKEIIQGVEVIKPEKQNKVVQIGNVVVMEYQQSKQTVTMRVDGVSCEKNVLSLQSPLGKLIQGKAVGESIEINKQPVIIKEIKLPE